MVGKIAGILGIGGQKLHQITVMRLIAIPAMAPVGFARFHKKAATQQGMTTPAMIV